MKIDMREASHPQEFKVFTTDRVRQEFLIENIFVPDEISLTYSFYDRMIAGGICPVAPLELLAHKELGTEFFLERREMGVINVGPEGKVTVDGSDFSLACKDGLFIGKGARNVTFSSLDSAKPARFYVLSAPAHQSLPTEKIDPKDAETVELGSLEESNVRTLRKYIYPGGAKSCQLCMGMTTVQSGSVWNSMPCHTHGRRMEVYFYFDLAGDAVLFHMMGQPDETRHIVVRNEEAVISPNWSIHAGAGTGSYSFIWGMVGENQVFGDMDAVEMADLR